MMSHEDVMQFINFCDFVAALWYVPILCDLQLFFIMALIF